MERKSKNTPNQKPIHLLFIDGKALGNPGAAAWAAIRVVAGSDIIEQGKSEVEELGGGSGVSTQTEIELIGLIQGLKALKGLPDKAADPTILTDSTYLYK